MGLQDWEGQTDCGCRRLELHLSQAGQVTGSWLSIPRLGPAPCLAVWMAVAGLRGLGFTAQDATVRAFQQHFCLGHSL